MSTVLDIDTLPLFILFVLPGLVSMRIYRLLIPCRQLDWGNACLEGLFYSAVNFALFLPLIVTIHHDSFPSKHPVWYGLLALLILLVGPIIWPIVYVKLVRSKKLMRGLQLPYPTAWDYFFDKRRSIFVLIHLKTGRMIGGYYGPASYATAYPDEGDIYLQAVYRVNDEGRFGEPIESTNGLLISKDQYSYIEFFGVPKQEYGGQEWQRKTQ